jgi:hypothetical protein
LQPPGDSATRKSLFDCLLAGAIPVLFDNMTAAQQHQWHLPRDTASYAITIDPKQVPKNPPPPPSSVCFCVSVCFSLCLCGFLANISWRSCRC